MLASRLQRARPTPLSERYSARRNAFGTLRVALAVGVIVAHAWPLGFGRPAPGHGLSSGQSDLGALSLYGFFFVSGFLITDSGLRSSFTRFVRARLLRVFPGLWVCLLVTAFAFAPFVALVERGTLRGFWSHPQGPVEYVRTNWFASMEQFTISGLLTSTPFGQVGGGPSAFDGSLWTLRYDLAFYAVVAVLIGTAVLSRAPRAVLVLTGGCYLLILRDVLTAPDWTSRPPAHGAVGPFPLIGSFAADWMLHLGFLFLLGAVLRLYAHRVPMDGRIATVAAVVTVGTLGWGGFYAFGLPAFTYLLLYVAVAAPDRFTRHLRRHDYTYGLYIYSFPVQQVIALLGGNRFGITAYVLLSVLGSLLFAVPSWHLVERPALRWKAAALPGRHRQRHHPVPTVAEGDRRPAQTVAEPVGPFASAQTTGRS
ncbi:acyltransferase family protein [Micromonospora sp. SH-82]|uniref:acyltransferase family protein n=1 Tax=Micromonospora sp. SH-82 TaxID=3132938 RepID=UPI003EBB8A56